MDIRDVGGLRCDEVLEALDRYVDGLLSDEELEMVQAHVQACANCRRFGGAYARVVAALRGSPANNPTVDDDESVPAGLLQRALSGLS
jgi:anti-sigma factor RsiW